MLDFHTMAMDDLVIQVQKTIIENRLIHPGDRIVVALSGGADSVTLLTLLKTLEYTALLPMTLEAIHIHHGLRKASDDEALYVERLCKEYQVPLYVVRVDLSEAIERDSGTELAARKARYEVFDRYAKKGWLVALGHHRDDQAETLLMRLIRGSGIKGLGGMAYQRDQYIRPLLDVGRQQIDDFCNRYHIDYVVDESNKDNHYFRNYIRNEIMPLVIKRQPEATKLMAQTGMIIRDDEAWIGTYIQSIIRNIQVDRESGTLNREMFLEQPIGLKRRILRALLLEMDQGLLDISYEHIAQMIAFIEDGGTGRQLQLPGERMLWLDYGKVILNSGKNPFDELWNSMDEIPIHLAGLIEERPYRIGDFEFVVHNRGKWDQIPKNVYTKWFDYDKIGDNLLLRSRRPGDYMHLGPAVLRKKLKNIMIDDKISRIRRDSIPLLAIGDEVIWLIGHRTNSRFHLDDATRHVLEVKYMKEDP